MKKSEFTDQQIAYALNQAESGASIDEVFRELGISQQTILTLEEEVRRAWHPRVPTLEAT